MQPKIKLAIVEDSQSFVATLRMYFAMSESVELVFTAEELEPLPDLCEKHRPDVLLLDYNLGYFTGIDALKLIHPLFPEIKVLMFTVLSEDDNIFTAITHGATGYLLKDTPLPEIEAAVMDTNEGGAPITPIVAARILHIFRQNNLSQRPLANLTPRENDILKALANGCSYKDAATKLNISLGTVRTHVESIYKKLDVNSKAEAVAKFLRGER